MALRLVVEKDVFTRSELVQTNDGDLCFHQVIDRNTPSSSIHFTRRLNSGVVDIDIQELPEELKQSYEGCDVVLMLYMLTSHGRSFINSENGVLSVYRVVDVESDMSSEEVYNGG